MCVCVCACVRVHTLTPRCASQTVSRQTPAFFASLRQLSLLQSTYASAASGDAEGAWRLRAGDLPHLHDALLVSSFAPAESAATTTVPATPAGTDAAAAAAAAVAAAAAAAAGGAASGDATSGAYPCHYAMLVARLPAAVLRACECDDSDAAAAAVLAALPAPSIAATAAQGPPRRTRVLRVPLAAKSIPLLLAYLYDHRVTADACAPTTTTAADHRSASAAPVSAKRLASLAAAATALQLPALSTLVAERRAADDGAATSATAAEARASGVRRRGGAARPGVSGSGASARHAATGDDDDMAHQEDVTASGGSEARRAERPVSPHVRCISDALRVLYATARARTGDVTLVVRGVASADGGDDGGGGAPDAADECGGSVRIAAHRFILAKQVSSIVSALPSYVPPQRTHTLSLTLCVCRVPIWRHCGVRGCFPIPLRPS